MSDIMLFGVIDMPYELAMGDEISRLQFYQRAQDMSKRLKLAESAITAEPQLTDAQIMRVFEAEMKADPDAYIRPGECVNQITSKEIVRAVRSILSSNHLEN